MNNIRAGLRQQRGEEERGVQELHLDIHPDPRSLVQISGTLKDLVLP